MARVDKRAAILAFILVILVNLTPSARAGLPPPHVAVPKSPILVGQPIYITYWTDVGQDGSVVLFIDKTPDTPPSLWVSDWINIKGGIAYDITAPGLSTPGTYYAEAAFCNLPVPPTPPCVGGPSAYAAFQVVATTTTTGTDWAVLSVSLSPPNPSVGDPVTLSMIVTALSSPGTFPQSFAAVCQIDGVSCGGGPLTYPGPLGTPMTVSTQTPWTATFGTHTLTWGVATIPVGQDPNKGNNVMSRTFTVAQVSTSTTTTPEYPNCALPLFASLALAIIILTKRARKTHHQDLNRQVGR